MVNKVTAMPAEPISSSGLRPALRSTGDRHEAGRDRDRPRHDIDRKRLALAEARELPQGRPVVEDHIDADELLEDGDMIPTQTTGRIPSSPRPLMSLSRGRWSALKVARISSSLARATSAPNKLVRTLSGFVDSALRDEITRAFGNEEKRNEEDRRRNGLHQVHPPPSLDSAPDAAVDTPARRCEEIVDHECGGEAGDDHDLLDRRQPAANFGGRDFGDVGRRQARLPRRRPCRPDTREGTRDDLRAPPWTSAPTRNSAAAIIIVLRRPIRSASRPAKKAPMKQPMSSEATVKPRPLLGDQLPARGETPE